jgi:Ca-activated chloride channel family protein
MAQAFAKRISPTLVAEQGTDIGKALQLASPSFSSQSGNSRVIVLITDGENHEQSIEQVAQIAKQEGVRIYTIGIGTPEGAPIEIGGEFVKDENGEMVVSKLDEQTLQSLATATGGAYVRATKQSIGLEEIVRSINQMEKSELSTVRYEEYNEQYQYFVAVALALLLLESVIMSRRNPALRRFNIFRE